MGKSAEPEKGQAMAELPGTGRQPAESIVPRRWREPGLLLVLVVLAGSIHGWLIGHTEVPARDSVGFIRYAWQLQHQNWIEVLSTSHQHPGYPVAILAASIPVSHFRNNSLCDVMVLSAQLVNWLAGCLLVIAMFYLGKELFDGRVGFWAAALYQCLPVAARVTSDGLSEGTFLLAAVVTLLVGVRAFRIRSAWRFGLCGACGGLCYLVRPEGALTVAAAALVLLGTQLFPQWRWPWRATLACAGSLGLAALGMAGPYIAVTGHLTNKPTGRAVMQIAYQEPGVRGRESGVRSQGSGVRSEGSGIRSQDSGIRSQESAAHAAFRLPVMSQFADGSAGVPPASAAETAALRANCDTTRLPSSAASFTKPGSPLCGSLVAVWWPSDRQTGWWEHFGWGLWAVGKEIVKGFFYIAWLPAILGLIWFRGRFREAPGPWILGCLCLLQTLVLWRVGLVVGYVSERHVLIIVLCGLYWAVAAIQDIPERWGWTLRWLGNARSQPVLIMLVLMLSCLPMTLQPLHANQVGHREAGFWLADHARPADTIVDPFNWAYYYSGRVFQEDARLSTGAEYKPLQYVVLEHSRKQHAGLTMLPLARQIAAHGQVVYDWKPSRHQLKHKPQEVQILAVPGR
jgi:4-amino-4-deoxy-L-arabinose transferase-like glycosyltransferase